MSLTSTGQPAGTVLILATLDTKGQEVALLKDLIEGAGLAVVLMDTNMGGEPAIPPDISSAEIAAAGGGDIMEIRSSRDTGKYTPIMIKGATVKAQELLANGRLDGIISIGGASGTTVGTTVMKGLPFGVPKLMVSSTASMPGYAAGYIGTKDIMMMHSVVDIAGLNDLVRDVLVRAAGAISGMAIAYVNNRRQAAQAAAETAAAETAAAETAAAVESSEVSGKRPLVGMTEFKFAEGCCKFLRQWLQEMGYDVIAFHAQGIGDQAMDELIDQGWFIGVLDIVPSGVSETILGGNRAGGLRRLLAAGQQGLPMVVTPSGFDMLSCGPLERRDRQDPLWVTRGLADRQLFVPDAFRVQARTTADELREIARETAHRLNMARGPVKFLIPRRGWSNLSSPGGSLYDPQADLAFVKEMKQAVQSPWVEITELDMELNSREFAKAVLDAFMDCKAAVRVEQAKVS